MILLRRGLAAGLTAGLVAGVFAIVVGEPPLEAAMKYEFTTVTHEHGHLESVGETAMPRAVQRAGLIGGIVLLGATLGLLFGVVAGWATGRVRGTAWQRAVKLGASALGVLVLLPALKYPPNPPGVGDAAMAGRTGGFLGLLLGGVVLSATAWFGARVLRRRVPGVARRKVVVGVAVVAGAAALLASLPTALLEHHLPAGILWRFRLAAISTQVLLVGGVAVTFGLLWARAEVGPKGAP